MMALQATLQLGYQVALAALTTGILLLGSAQMKRTVLTVFTVLVAAWLLRGYWPGTEYAAMMIGVDALACIAITWHPAGRWQSVVGLSYVMQIIVHIARIIRGADVDFDLYWWALSLLAFLQLFLIGGWWAHGKFVGRRRRNSPRPISNLAHSQSMEK